FLSQETIYTIKLRRRGIDIFKPAQSDPLSRIRVADVMVHQVVSLDEGLPLRAILERLHHPFSSFPVTDGNNALVGILGYSELRGVLTSEHPDETLTAHDLMQAPAPVSYPDESLTEIMERFTVTGAGRLPVVSRENPTMLLGVISHSDLLAAYQRAVLEKPRSG
ncbi:MAG TPA: CBS domain-containing protein, partial [Candidatus Methylomirabilis sp.]|nr:CBS domain-containing protein [Candidatus Methylomirabilis sp.]